MIKGIQFSHNMDIINPVGPPSPESFMHVYYSQPFIWWNACDCKLQLGLKYFQCYILE